MNTKDHSISWRFFATGLLSSPGFPRAFDVSDLEEHLSLNDIQTNRRSLFRLLKEWEVAKVVVPVARGVYLNMQATPQPLLREAVAKMRPGAIVSLATVLGDAGVLNNPTPWVMAVQPSNPNIRLANEVSSHSGAVFQFALMRHDLLYQEGTSWTNDAFTPYSKVPTATPEKALLDWIYLSSSPRGAKRWTLPASHDLDLDYLDMERANRLSERMGMRSEWNQFQELHKTTPRVKIKRAPRVG